MLASGGGSNFQSLIDRFESEEAPARIVGLIASRDTAGAIDRARRAEIPVAIATAADAGGEADLLNETLDSWQTDLVVLAGYLRLVPGEVVARFFGRMINIHPALLPAFGGQGMYGRRVHEAVLESGVRLTGVTVHFVDEAFQATT